MAHGPDAAAVSPAAAGGGHVRKVLPLLPQVLHRVQEVHGPLPLQRRVLPRLRQRHAAAGSHDRPRRRLTRHLPDHGLLRQRSHRR